MMAKKKVLEKMQEHQIMSESRDKADDKRESKFGKSFWWHSSVSCLKQLVSFHLTSFVAFSSCFSPLPLVLPKHSPFQIFSFRIPLPFFLPFHLISHILCSMPLPMLSKNKKSHHFFVLSLSAHRLSWPYNPNETLVAGN